MITSADTQDRGGAKAALRAFRTEVKFPTIIWADQADQAIVRWALARWLWVVEIVTRLRGAVVIQPKRWIVERTFG